ncbi:hypothetical protein NLX85_24190, partial [Micromonospora sp. A3M-1-15]|nr:hypothetical protein [Micromonospora sp. A3M-1-15]
VNSPVAVVAGRAGAVAGRPVGVPGGAPAGRAAAAARTGGNRAGRRARGRLGLFPGLVDALPGGPATGSVGQVRPVGGRPPAVGPPRPPHGARARLDTAPAPARPRRAVGAGATAA